ncbi:hypothetical protein [Pseudonocardia kunmingensis]|uniref:hypothetical protein n=1 Tax=Pseudonocardia kunmingensis TaxID=630975 RepID=UPI00114F7A63|nr:hypothetical protein [Pseudonocardia kunmingensis]
MSAVLLLVVVLGVSSTSGTAAAGALRPTRADDAVRACGVTQVDNVKKIADVPAEYQDGYFMSIPTAVGGPVVLLCGNGTSTGAVHIEVKHDVPNWADALNCIENAMVHGKPTV